MIEQKTFFELISKTLRVFQAPTKEELREKLVEKIKWQKQQLELFQKDYERHQKEVERRQKEIDECEAHLIIYESELKQHFGE